METVDDYLFTEQVQKENAEEKFDKELDEILERMLLNNARLRYMYNQGWQDTREAIKEAVAETVLFFKEN